MSTIVWVTPSQGVSGYVTRPGVMAATIAGLFTSLATSAAKRVFGYIEGGNYYPGRIRLDI